MPHKGFQPSKEHREHLSNALKNRKLTDDWKQKISKKLKGKKLSLETRHKMSIAQKGKKYALGYKHSIETRRKMSESRTGKKHPRWKGGISPIHEQIRHSSQYRDWRQRIFIRDNFTCQKCGATGIYLHVHHIISFVELLNQTKYHLPLFNLYDGAMLYAPLWNIGNGITLCVGCHNKTKKKKNMKKQGIQTLETTKEANQ
jgi:5-methylcytosine-specific restriction endonuclease McrA